MFSSVTDHGERGAGRWIGIWGEVQRINMKKAKTIHLVLCAFFAALTAVSAQIAIPIGPVPISLATFSVFMTGALLGGRLGAVSQAAYVLLGAAGVPVFAGFKGGLGALFGPTGGYIAGYILAAWLIGSLAERSGNKPWGLLSAMLAGFFAYMIPGTGWFMFITQNGLAEALMICVVPFLPGDALKMILAAALACRLRPFLRNEMERGQAGRGA